MSLIDAIPQNNPSTIEEWADGSFGAPSAKFAAEPTTGFYRPGAGVIGATTTMEIPGFTSRDDTIASAASEFNAVEFTPGTRTYTGSTGIDSHASYRFNDTEVANGTATIADLYNVYAETPTVGGTATRVSAVGAEFGSGIAAFHAAGTVGNGTGFNIALAVGESFDYGGLAGIRVSGDRYSILRSPLDTAWTKGLVFQNDDYLQVTADEGLFAAAQKVIGVSSTPVPGGWGAGIPTVPQSGIVWNDVPTNDVTMFAVSEANGEIQFVSYDNRLDDYAQPVATNPTIKVFSDADAGTATDQWLSFAHDGTDGVIATGTGVVDINANVEIGASILGFYGTSGVAKPNVSGAALGNAALNNLVIALASLGLITNSITP